jgi:hypothetical protein
MYLGATSYMRNVPAFLRKLAEDLVTYDEVVPRVRAWLCSDLSFPFVVNSYFMIFICCCPRIFRNHQSVREKDSENEWGRRV